MASSSNMIQRKAINVSGRLGSFYDASTDTLVHQHSVQASETTSSHQPSICLTWSGDQVTNLIDCLQKMSFDDGLQLSILIGMVKPTGVSSLINYNRPIGENTRFLYYSYRSKKEKLCITPEKADRVVPVPSASNGATHMITDILWGFEICCVIPIPDYESASTVDSLLDTISKRLRSKVTDFGLSDTDKQQIKRLTNVTVYGSETCIDRFNIPLLTVLTNLNDWKRNENFHHPLIYMMCSLRSLFNNDRFPDYFDFSVQTYPDFAKLLSTIVCLVNQAKYLQRQSERLPQNFPSSTLEQMLKDVQQRLYRWLTMYEEFRTRLRKALINVRLRSCGSAAILDVMSRQQYSLLRETEVTALDKTIKQLLTKRILIKRLDEDQIQYINVIDLRFYDKLPVTQEEIEKALQSSFLKKDSCMIGFYSNDRFKDEDSVAWEPVYQKFIAERQKKEERTTLVYVDFTECQCELKQLVIVPLLVQVSLANPPELPPELEAAKPSTTESASDRPLPPPETEINVLLLGETGVGKSTFINAFVNYLLFDTLQQAEQSEPVVLIPVSFLITTGDQFEERIVKFGDSESNQNHKHQGQSVTQHCKSYVFHLTDTVLLRLIDTPGMGDTRGVAQDEKNINHILTYINNLSHLYAICLLLKPNASRLNIFFRSSLSQLLMYLTPIGYNNLIFCFTNARSTFFMPGDAGPLIRKMLKQEYHNVSFEKQNTFCFDSESFRFLAAKKRGVDFDEFKTQNCIRNWTRMVKESVRLLNFIQTREPYHLDQWQSLRKAAIEISTFARPLMETLRLILYNWKLRETDLLQKEMIICVNPVIIEMCSHCAQSNIINLEPLYIVEYVPNKDKAAQNCQCPFDERHFLIESTVKHEFGSQPMKLSADELKKSFHSLLFRCDRLTHFVRQKGLSNENDPFTIVLERFLEEEKQIAKTVTTNLNINKRVMEMLGTIKQTRQQNKQQLTDLNEKLGVKDVYKIINELKAVRSINERLECIKTSRHSKMVANEYQVTIPAISNKLFVKPTNSFQ